MLSLFEFPIDSSSHMSEYLQRPWSSFYSLLLGYQESIASVPSLLFPAAASIIIWHPKIVHFAAGFIADAHAYQVMASLPSSSANTTDWSQSNSNSISRSPPASSFHWSWLVTSLKIGVDQLLPAGLISSILFFIFACHLHLSQTRCKIVKNWSQWSLIDFLNRWYLPKTIRWRHFTLAADSPIEALSFLSRSAAVPLCSALFSAWSGSNCVGCALSRSFRQVRVSFHVQGSKTVHCRDAIWSWHQFVGCQPSLNESVHQYLQSPLNLRKIWAWFGPVWLSVCSATSHISFIVQLFHFLFGQYIQVVLCITTQYCVAGS